MTIKKFGYLKEDTHESKYYELLVLNKSENNEYGIALNYLTEDERKEVISIQETYEEKLKPFMKAYRNFKKANMRIEE